MRLRPVQAEDAFESSDLGHRRRERGLDGVARPGKADLGFRAQSRAAPAPGLAPGGWQHDRRGGGDQQEAAAGEGHGAAPAGCGREARPARALSTVQVPGSW